MLTWAVLVGLLSLGDAAAQPIPVGPEFQINTNTALGQYSPNVAADDAGNFIVVWESDIDPDPSTGQFQEQGRAFDDTAVAAGSEFDLWGGWPWTPGIAFLGSNKFILVGSASSNIFGQFFDASGAALDPTFTIFNGSVAPGDGLRVASLGSSDFVVTWEKYASSTDTDGDGFSIHAQLVDGSGSPIGTPFQVNAYTTSHQSAPRVAANAAGNFVVVWESIGSSGSDSDDRSVQAQAFDSTGTPIGSEFQVNSYTTGHQGYPSVGVDDEGEFLVAWSSNEGTARRVLGQLLSGGAGAPVGTELEIVAASTTLPSRPVVSGDGGDDFVVVWEDHVTTPALDWSILGQSVSDSGALLGPQFQVNVGTSGYDGVGGPQIAVRGSGDFVVVWTGPSANDDRGILGRIYAPLLPEQIDEPVAAGGTVTSDSEADGASASDPIETSVTSPNAGSVSISETVVSSEPPVIEVDIEAPDGTVANPLVLEFRIDAVLANSFKLYKNGALVTGDCTGAPGTASPDPCIASTTTLPDDDVLVTVNTSTASVWRTQLATACAPTPLAGCLGGEKASVQIRLDEDDSKNQLKWKLTKGDAFDTTVLGDPATSRAYTLCVYDETADAPALVTSMRIDANASWVDKDTKGFSYLDKAGVEDGVTKAALRTGSAGKAGVSVAAKGSLIPMPPPVSGTRYLHQDTSVVVQLVSNELPAVCWTTEFTTASKNDGTQFKAKAP